MSPLPTASAAPRAPVAGRHHPITIALHWFTLLLILGGLAAVFGRELVDDKATRLLLLELHRNAGLLVLGAVLARALLRTTLGIGDVNLELSRRMRLLSSLNHCSIYAVLIALPFVGWLLSNTHGQSPNLFGLLPLPVLTGRDRDLADRLLEVHQALSWALLVLTLLHAAAALWHHYVRRDGVLRSILPLRAARRGGETADRPRASLSPSST